VLVWNTHILDKTHNTYIGRCLTEKSTDIMAYTGGEVEPHPFLTSPLHGDKWSEIWSRRISCRESPDTQWIGGWVGARCGADAGKEKIHLTLLGLEQWFFGRPVRSISHYTTSPPTPIQCKNANHTCNWSRRMQQLHYWVKDNTLLIPPHVL